MIKKKSKILIARSGNGSTSNRVTIPVDFIQALQLDKDNRDIEIELTEDKEIIIRKI